MSPHLFNWQLIMRVQLRDYQLNVVDAVRNGYASGFRSILVVLPTGGGKTVIFCNITERTAMRGNRVMMLVHRQELLTQTSEHLERLGVDHGIIAPGHSMTGDVVQVASVQTLVKRIDRVPPPSLIIVDECHHANASSWRAVIDRWPQAFLLGVTATPCRLDGTGLGRGSGGYFDTMIEGPTVRQLIDDGHLAPPLIYAPPTDLDLSGVHIKMGDYVQSEVAQRIDKPKITGSAIEHYMRLCPGAPAIAFCASVQHAEHVAAEFNAYGIPASSIDGKLPDSVRKSRITGLANGQFKVLTSCNIISEGTDIPVVTAAILLRPTQSLGLYLQQVGRCLRTHPQKTHAIVLDHVGNCLRHGLPDDVRSWSLNARKKKSKADDESEVKFRRCANCFAVFGMSVTHCPQCGTKVSWKPKEREVKQVAGELKLLSGEDIEKMNAARHARQEQGRAMSLEALRAIAVKRGYRPEWAERVWDAKRRKIELKQSRWDAVSHSQMAMAI